jgi:hypothetical protein
VLLASAAQGLDTTAHTNALWGLLAYITCRTEGTSGTFMSGGWINLFNLLASTAANLLPAMLGSAGAPGASGNVAVTVDTTVAKAAEPHERLVGGDKPDQRDLPDALHRIAQLMWTTTDSTPRRRARA